MNAARQTFAQKAEAAWAPAPEWVSRLAEEADRTSLAAAAKRVNYSSPTVSQVISNTYAGKIIRVEEMVRGALMSAIVNCPVKGEMGRDVCLRWQDKPFAPTSTDRSRMYHACRSGCPHSKHTKETSDA